MQPWISRQKELKEIERDKTSGVTVQLVGASMNRLTGFVNGALMAPHSRAHPWRCNVTLIKLQHFKILSGASFPHTGPRDTAYDGGIFVVDIELGVCASWVVAVHDSQRWRSCSRLTR